MSSLFPVRRYVRPIALACALALAAPLALAGDGVTPPKGVAAGPCVEGICEYTLGNGLRVLLFPDASKPTVTVNIAYGVGSVHENYGETGMAHLLEHLLFKGTPTHRDIPGALKARGIEKNATTWLDRTNYFGSFPASDETLDWLLGMEADRMVNSFVAKADLDSEMTVVRNEMERNENNPGAVLFERMRSTAYLWHNYGNSTIGARSDVENVSIERLQAFYRTWYRPDNATLIIAGRIDPAKTLGRVQAHFGKLKRPATSLPRLYTAEPTQDGEREVTVRRTGDIQYVAASFHVPGATHPDNAAIAVLMNILGDTPTGRLHKRIVETRQGVFAGAFSESFRDSSMATLLAVAQKDGDLQKAEDALLAQVGRLTATDGEPITQTELDAAKQRLANGFETGFSDVNGVAMALTESIAAGDWRLYFLRRDRIAAVTLDDVNRVARTYLKTSNRTLGRFIPTDTPDRAVIPAAQAASDALRGFVGKAAVSAGEQFDPTPSNIQARTETFTIGEGLKVSLLPKDTRSDTVIVQGTFRFGNLDALKAHAPMTTGMAGSLLMHGSSTMSREEIARRLESLKAEGGVSGGLQSASMNFIARRETLADVLALAADLLRNPAYPESEFEQQRQQMIAGLEASRNEPGTIAGTAMAKHFDPWPAGHPYRTETTEEMLAAARAVKREDVVAFHRAFYGTADGEIAIVGDFDPVAIKAQLKTLFGDWKSPVPYARIPTTHTDVAASSQRFETPDKANASIVARMNISLNQNDADYPALIIANRIFGGDPLKARLADRLRQKEGLTYGTTSSVTFSVSPSGRDDAGSLWIRGIAAPENVEKLVASMRDELARFVRDGITADELADAKRSLLTERRQGRSEDGALASSLANNLFLGRTMAWWADADAKVEALTVEQVNAAIRKHIRPDNLSVFAAGDFAKAKAKSASAGSPASK
jgi:zinc protease